MVLGGYILEFLGSAGRLVGVLWWGRNWGRDYFSTQGTSRGARFAFAFARGLLSKMAIDGVTSLVLVLVTQSCERREILRVLKCAM